MCLGIVFVCAVLVFVTHGSSVSLVGRVSYHVGNQPVIDLVATFLQPPCGEVTPIRIYSTRWMTVGSMIFIENGGHYYVAAILDDYQFLALNKCDVPGNIAAGKGVMGAVRPSALVSMTGPSAVGTNENYGA